MPNMSVSSAYVVSHCAVCLMEYSGVQLVAYVIACNHPYVSQLESVYARGLNTWFGMGEVGTQLLAA
jgi:hypothetical protein